MSGVGVLLLFQPCPADGPTPFAQVLIALMTVYLTAVDRFKEGMSHQNDVLPAARGSWTEGGGCKLQRLHFQNWQTSIFCTFFCKRELGDCTSLEKC